jgi:hypothetical protein
MMVNIAGIVASGSLARLGDHQRREYQTASNETIMRIPSGNSRIVFIYFSLAMSKALPLNKEMLRFPDTQRVGRETCQRIPFVFVNIEDAQEVGQRHKFQNSFSDLQQLDIAASGARGNEAGDYLSQAARIDMSNTEQVQKYQRLLFAK